MNNNVYDSLVQEVVTILERNVRGKQSKVLLSKETAALLSSVMEPAAIPVFVSEEAETLPPYKRGQSKEANQEPDAHLVEPFGEDLLNSIRCEISLCKQCPLHKTRLNTVPGEGNPKASLVFVGEAPGEYEDKQGRPFVGRAGKLLTDIITKGMKISREDVFICNVLKCRPPDNRTPNPEEVMCCEPFLLRQLDIIRPKVICALGATAAHTLLKTNDTIAKLRGKWHSYHDIAFRVTYHPSYLLRSPDDKKKTWEDVKEIMRYLEQ